MKKLRTLKTARKSQGIKQTSLADAIGMHQAALSSLEHGRETAHLPYLMAIEAELGESVNWFTGNVLSQDDSLEIAEIIKALAARVPIEVILPYVSRVINTVEHGNLLPALHNVALIFKELEKGNAES